MIFTPFHPITFSGNSSTGPFLDFAQAVAIKWKSRIEHEIPCARHAQCSIKNRRLTEPYALRNAAFITFELLLFSQFVFCLPLPLCATPHTRTVLIRICGTQTHTLIHSAATQSTFHTTDDGTKTSKII